MVNYIPDFSAKRVLSEVPTWESSSASDATGRRTGKSLKTLMTEVVAAFDKLNAFNVGFEPVIFQTRPERFGYVINFTMIDQQNRSFRGRMYVAALPLEKFTQHKKERALSHALYMFRDWLNSQYNVKIFMPGVEPLVPYLLDRNTDITFMELAAADRQVEREGAGIRALPEGKS